MPIDYRIDPENKLVLVKGYGDFGFNDLQKFRAKLVKDPLFHEGMKELADYRAVEEHHFTREGFQQFIEQEKQFINLLRDYQIAIVTNSDLHYGFARMYMAKMSDLIPKVRVFRDIEEAETWLLDEGEQSTASTNSA